MTAPRNVLIDELEKWSKMGYRPMVGLELEAFLFEPDDEGWRPITTPGHYVYGTGMAVDPSGTIDEIMTTAREVGLPLESVHSEFDNGQFELTLAFTDALAAADEAFLFKVMAKEVAAKRGMLLTFMGKPISERGGSGLHVNLSIEDSTGANLFPDEASEDGLSQLARDTIRRHASPSRRYDGAVGADGELVQTSAAGVPVWLLGQLGIRPSWGDGSRTPGQRTANTSRVQVWLTVRSRHTKQLPQFWLPRDSASRTTMSWHRQRHSTASRTPRRTSSCQPRLQRPSTRWWPTMSVEALGPEFVDGFVTVKRAEWDRYRLHTTDWETSEYLPFL